MKLVRCALLALLAVSLLTTRSMQAQMSVYGTVGIDAFGFDGGNFGNGSFKSTTGGVTGGGFYTFPSQSRFKAGIDGRVLYSPGYNGGSASTGALRVGFVPNRNPLRPYLQIGGGVVHTQLHETICSGFSCGTQSSSVNSGAAQFLLGLDVRINRSFDIRAIEYGADAGSSGGNATHAVAGFLSAGLVYHLHTLTHS